MAFPRSWHWMAGQRSPHIKFLIEFLKYWGVHHRLSSVASPHNNCCAEMGIKTVKRLIIDKTIPESDLDTDAFQRAMLQYRNTPYRYNKLSPAFAYFAIQSGISSTSLPANTNHTAHGVKH
ncbi:hypothetical protein ElyMa_003543900 [Elysia marginata]|uniref:Integrase catalytic domain-containing protein n=1 Tax=Elysia marginata TaxID=1093978 RepID=A0AAV4EKD1_9GAST|nr:hypothetical protein ElyMa_003543900 [Elysia marginata]